MSEFTLGFSGSASGMSPSQDREVLRYLLDRQPTIVRHGDCVGSDERFHQLVRLWLPETQIIIHPPNDPKKRAFCEGDIIHHEKSYLRRNADIVFLSDELIATPKTPHEVRRSGTWATIRYARDRYKIPYQVFKP